VSGPETAHTGASLATSSSNVGRSLHVGRPDGGWRAGRTSSQGSPARNLSDHVSLARNRKAVRPFDAAKIRRPFTVMAFEKTSRCPGGTGLIL
jgi:hypothetical protein